MDCKGTDRVCIESATITTGTPFTVWWPNTQIPVPDSSTTISMFQGKASEFSDLCNIPKSVIQEWPVQQSQWITYNGASGVSGFNVTVNYTDSLAKTANTTNAFFFRLQTSAGTCLLGPIRNGGTPAYVTLTAVIPETLATVVIAPLPTPDPLPSVTPNAQSPAPQPGSDGGLGLGALIGIVVGGIVLILAVVGLVVYNRRRDPIKRHGNTSSTSVAQLLPVHQNTPPPIKTEVEVVSDLTAEVSPRGPKSILTTEEARILASTFRQQLVDPEDGWDQSLTRSSTGGSSFKQNASPLSPSSKE
ncbi:hypothetical protein EDD86DRAFT_204257 [Gorgonomyces haynaldii]|nr:hypothetical protein EDD86DRAFT_204257 [Gorgonomyces haynaldii]